MSIGQTADNLFVLKSSRLAIISKSIESQPYSMNRIRLPAHVHGNGTPVQLPIGPSQDSG
jgi:hypothetical protein